MVLTIFGGIATNKLVDDAKTFDEYADILYRTMFLYIISVFYAYIICKTPELFEFVNKLESSVGRSKYIRDLSIDRNWNSLHSIYRSLRLGSALDPKLLVLYTAASQRITKWIRPVHFILIKATPPLCTSPSIVASFYVYYTTDLGNDAFAFVYAMW